MSLYSLWIGKCSQPSLCTLRLCTYWGCDSVWICTSTSDKHDQKWTSSSFLWKARILQFSAQFRNFPIWPKLLRNYVFSADKENCNFSIMDSFWAAGNIPPLPAFIFPDFGLLSVLLIAQIFLRDMMMMLPECPGRPKDHPQGGMWVCNRISFIPYSWISCRTLKTHFQKGRLWNGFRTSFSNVNFLPYSRPW